MSLDYSVASLLDRLLLWGGLPKYSMERRLDLFLTPFLEALVGHQLGGKARLVLPEFPLRTALRPKTADDVSEKKQTAHTANADYLLELERTGGKRCWLFLELKTDAASFDEDQALLYLAARNHERRMAGLREDIVLVRDRSREAPEKYQRVLDVLGTIDDAAQPIEVAYLGPSELEHTVREWNKDRADKIDHYVTLARFAALPASVLPGEHWELWLRVRELLLRLDAGEHVRDPG